MSRLEKSTPLRQLSEAQKQALAEIDSEYGARIAERKIFLEGEILKAGAGSDPAAVADLRRQLASDIVSLEEKREEKKEKLRREMEA